jgi:hypothetical protein
MSLIVYLIVCFHFVWLSAQVCKERDERANQCRASQAKLDQLSRSLVALTAEVEGADGMRAQLK